MKIKYSTRSLLLLALATTLLFSTVSAKDQWLQVRSKNFNLIGNASEKDIRKVAVRLEQFRETFRLLFKQVNLNSPIPTNVLVFKSESSYKQFKPKRADGKIDNFVAGYFQGGEDVNYITLSTEGEDADTFGTIFHEYVHFMVDTTFGKSEVPPWFNEGLAEYYQTFAIEADQKIKLGLPQNGHLNLLQETKLIPLETLFKISNYALHQNGNHSRSIFYAESWALIHYLVQTGKSEGLGKFLDFAMKNVPPETAFQDSFQMTYAQMEKDLSKYVAQNTYKYSLVTLKNKMEFDGEIQVSLLSDAAANAYLGDLLYHTNRADDAEEYLQKALALEPDSSMANTTLGMVKMRQRKYAEAKNYLEKAISEDQKNHLAFYRYAYLLSREDRDDYGYVNAFPAEKAAKMREMLKKAIAINPAFTESYELLAFVNIVNNEQLDESVQLLQNALNYQPGNQRYAMRIAEIYMRQDKFSEAAAIAAKIAQTADEPDVKTQAENLNNQIRQRQEFSKKQEEYRQKYDNSAVSSSNGSGNGQTVILRRSQTQSSISPEETAKIEAAAKLRSVNLALRKPESSENRALGRIQNIDCKNKSVTYTVKTADENFKLSSKDFESLNVITFIPESQNISIGCGAKVEDILMVLTFKSQPDAKTGIRGELVAVEFVPNNFHLMTETEMAEDPYDKLTNSAANSDSEVSPTTTSAASEGNLNYIKNSLRQPQTGEKREMGFIEKMECSPKGNFFYIKTANENLILSVNTMQPLQIRGFTPEIQQIKFACGMKRVDIPVVFSYKSGNDVKTGATGEIISLEFVPKNFKLD